MIKLPIFLAAELTYKCNHQCIFCSCPWENDISLSGNEMTAEQWKRVFEKVKIYGVKHITFSGGEPAIRADIFDILRYAKELGFTLGLNTNGCNINKDFLYRLRDFDIQLSISVPGIKTFAQTTKNDNIENVLNLFRQCDKLNIKTVANIAVTKINIGELYENIAFPLINGASYILLNRFLPGGRGLANTEYLLTIAEINQMLDIAEEVLSKADTFGHLGTELPYCVIKNPHRYKHLSISSLCAAAKSFFVIDPSGYIKVCNHSPTRICRWDEIENLENSKYWNKYVSVDYIPKMCKDCKYLYVKCDGGCREAAHVYYGNINDFDPCFMENNNE